MSLTFPSKVLLFGEYTTLRGAQTLALPSRLFAGRWAWAEQPVRETDPASLRPFCDFLAQKAGAGQPFALLDTGSFRKDLAAGLYFESNIPQGYGLGSSGALCAAILQRYGGAVPESLDQLRRLLAAMEAFFHGQSSGTDPLVAYGQKPLLITPPNRLEWVDITPEARDLLGRFFLIDTGRPRQTGPLVAQFRSMCAQEPFLRMLDEALVPATSSAIRSLQAGNRQALDSSMDEISRLQLENFFPMIPDFFREIWLASLAGDQFRLKLCGAGGGGFMLGYRLAEEWPSLPGLEVLPYAFPKVVSNE